MDISRQFINNPTRVWLAILLLGVGGLLALLNIGRLEDPAFTIKTAVIVTHYPGASAQQVEEEVTLPLENAIQQLPSLDNVSSISSNGLSQITVNIASQYHSSELPQIWDELRRRVGDASRLFPPGVVPPFVNDDFGDVFGFFFAISGDSFTNPELVRYAEQLRRELVLVPGVGKVAIGGVIPQQINVDISLAKMAARGITLNQLAAILARLNVVSSAGEIRVGSESIRLHPTGEFQSIDELGDLLVSPHGADYAWTLIVHSLIAFHRQDTAPAGELLSRAAEATAALHASAVTQFCGLAIQYLEKDSAGADRHPAPDDGIHVILHVFATHCAANLDQWGSSVQSAIDKYFAVGRALASAELTNPLLLNWRQRLRVIFVACHEDAMAECLQNDIHAALESWRTVNSSSDAIIPHEDDGTGTDDGDGSLALSTSEWRVVERVIAGYTNAQAAEALYLSKRTGDTHLRNIHRRLGISSRTELIKIVGASRQEPAPARRPDQADSGSEEGRGPGRSQATRTGPVGRGIPPPGLFEWLLRNGLHEASLHTLAPPPEGENNEDDAAHGPCRQGSAHQAQIPVPTRFSRRQ